MSEPDRLTPAQQAIGDFAPKLVSLTDDVLFGDVWERAQLSKRDRSLVTVAALIAGANTEQLKSHLARAKTNGLTEPEPDPHLARMRTWLTQFPPAATFPPAPTGAPTAATNCR